MTARAATVAALSRAMTSSSVSAPWSENAAIRPWSTLPATIGTMIRLPGRPSTLPSPCAAASVRSRPERSTQLDPYTAARASVSPLSASTRPSGVVITTAEASRVTSRVATSGSPPPSSTIWTSAAVHLVGSGQRGRLPVEQVGQHLLEDVVERDPVRQPDHREATPIGLGEHRGRQRVQVAAELDPERGQPALVQVRHQ